MRLSDAAALTTLLARLSRPPSNRPERNVREHHACRTPEGVEFDLYRPAHEPRTSVVALHGVTVNSRHDPRLVHFARSLAATGIACIVPTVSQLSSCRWSLDDLDEIESVHREAMALGLPRPGIIGFSYGASYGLVAAARPSIADNVSFVLAFGACHSFVDLFDYYVEMADDEPRTQAARDDLIYLHAVLAKGLRGKVELPSGLDDEVDAILKRYCHEATAAEKQRLFDDRLKGLGLPRLGAGQWDRAVLEGLSPKGRMAGITCPVSLLHDSHDTIVPPEHSRRIHAELVGSAPERSHRLLVTPLLSHVTLADAIRLADVTKLFRALGPVVTSTRKRA